MASEGVSLGLPSTALVGRSMPKKAFYEHLEVSAAVKDEFVHSIERIELVAVLKESSIHVPAGETVAEVDVLGIHLKDDAAASVPLAAIDLIARSIPNKLLFACFSEGKCKLLVRRGMLYETEWVSQDEARLQLQGSTLDKLWDSLGAQVVFGDADPSDLTGRLQRKGELESLREQLKKLQKKRQAERQIARRNALWDQIKSVENRIAELEAR